jgi:hypothetical protein
MDQDRGPGSDKEPVRREGRSDAAWHTSAVLRDRHTLRRAEETTPGAEGAKGDAIDQEGRGWLRPQAPQRPAGANVGLAAIVSRNPIAWTAPVSIALDVAVGGDSTTQAVIWLRKHGLIAHNVEVCG